MTGNTVHAAEAAYRKKRVKRIKKNYCRDGYCTFVAAYDNVFVFISEGSFTGKAD